MAKEKGFYSDAGLNVNIMEFDNGIEVTDDVVSGKSDFGIGRSSLIYDRYNDKPVVMLGAIFQHSPVILLTKKRDDIVKVEDLKDKKIMLTTDQVAMASINAMLQSRQISSEMYTTQAHSFDVQDLINGKTDAMLSYISNEPYAMKTQNIKYTIFSPKEYNFDFYSDILFTSEALLQKNPQIVKDFRLASLRGWDYAIEHKEEAVGLILKKYNTQKKTKEALLYEADAIEKLINKNEIKLGNIDSKRIEYITQIYSLMGLIKESKPIDGLVYKVETSNIELTREERAWIDSHTVKIGVEQWKPVVFSNTGKDIDGIGGEFTNKIIKNTGLKVEVINDNWDKLLKDFENKKIDLLPATYYTKRRAKFGLYSDAYFKMKDAVYLKETNHDIKQLKDLEGKTLAIPKGYGTIDKLKKEFPKINLVLTKDLDDSIDRVLSGRVTAFYEGHIAAETKINDELIKGLKAISIRDFKAPTLHYFSNIDEPLLHSIIQKGLRSLTYQDKVEIISKWATSDIDIVLADNEQKWLDKEQEVTYVFDPNWKPLEWKDDLENHTGIIADLIKLIETKSGINFVEVPVNSWDEAIKKVKTKEADMFSGIGETQERKEYVDFTKESLFSTPFVFVSRHGEDYLNGFSDTKDKRLAVTSNTTIEDKLKNSHSDIKFISFKTDEESFEKLINNEIDVFVVNAATARYYINNLGHKDLKIAYKTEYNLELKIALSKDSPKELLSIINKSIHAISKSELSNIFDKWTQAKVSHKTDWILIAKISGSIILILLFVLFNNRKLKQMVAKKTIDIENKNRELLELSAGLEQEVDRQVRTIKDSERKMKALYDAAPDAITIMLDGKWVDCNPATLKLFGFNDKKEFINKLPSDISPKMQPDGMLSRDKVFHAVEKAIELGSYQMEWEHIRFDNGKPFTCDVILAPMILEEKTHMYAMVRDISKRKALEKEIEDVHKHTRESIEYASLIQGALIPDNHSFKNYFSDFFTIWQPKDIVGGDIYLFEELRDKDECLLMVIDCTGHGVPGAFVTMLVKAIERQVVAKIENDKNIDVSPAWILSYFNKKMKILLKQEDKDSISNAGFDGQIIYYNKKDKILKYAGAEASLFYIDENNELQTIKGSRHSIGYKKSDANFKFKEFSIAVKENMKFYCTTDGYIDQNGGVKDFPLGKTKFTRLILQNHNETFTHQKEVLLNSLSIYQGKEERNDDVTVIGFEI
ncbi:transporter substrate-binding domain-containing protein [Sulfurimonas sp. MAG313]|nr:transporter substrate-binding domain-containing protein [Sulfurimonas sp. MAG313]